MYCIFKIEWDEEYLPNYDMAKFVKDVISTSFTKVTEIKPSNFCYAPMTATETDGTR